MIEAILGLIKAIPILDSWFQQLTALYVEQKLASMRTENREAIRKAVYEHDQRPAEVALGNLHPGEPSGVPGSVIVPTLPGVPKDNS